MYSNIVLKAKEYVKDLLSSLNKNKYRFHNIDHTISVFERASYLAIQEWLDEELQEIVQLAALFHDTWFIKQYDENEVIWAEIAEKWLKENSYPDDKIEIVKNTILATILWKQPTNKLEEIIKDADMDNLWRDDFCKLWKALREEILNIKGNKFSDIQWYENTLKLPFNFYTQTQKKERNKKLEENKKKLEEKIKSLQSK